MSDNPLKPPDPRTETFNGLSIDDAEHIRVFNRTPRPYHRDGLEIHQDIKRKALECGAGVENVVSQHEPQHYKTGPWDGQSGENSIAGSESGTEADDERPTFVKTLPPASLRPRKGLKTGEKNEDALLTPSQLDPEGRKKEVSHEDERAEREVLSRRRLAEFTRRSSEVGLMTVIILCVLCGRGVLRTALQWRKELLSHVVIMATLIFAYPIKLSIVDTRAQRTRFWQRFRVPASFDPATVLYPPLLPVLVALSVSPNSPAVILPNIVLGLASLPQRLFPRSSRLGGFNALHWLISVVPLILSDHRKWLFSASHEKSMAGMPNAMTSETLVSLYPLHHALLLPLYYLTTTSLLMSELHLLSVGLINLLLLASSPQAVILKACLWIGGVSIFVICGPVLRWNVILARIPKWKFRRPGQTAEDRRSLVDAVSDLIYLQRASGAFRSNASVIHSDADEDEPKVSIKSKMNGFPKISTKGLHMPALESATKMEPKSAVEPRQSITNGFLYNSDGLQRRPRRNTLPVDEGTATLKRELNSRQKSRTKVLWYLHLTAAQAQLRKWAYAGYFYILVVAVALFPVRWYIEKKALHGQDPFGWAVSYLFGQIPLLRALIEGFALSSWVQLPPAVTFSRNLTITMPLDVNTLRIDFGFSNVRILLIGYWSIVLLVGLSAVISMTAFVEVDTRRKVFHGVMVAMLLPSIYVDPCYCALALTLVLAVFLLLEVIRASQILPLGNAIGKFVGPYIDGRDLRGPVVVSHIFLLIGCAVPFWCSLASMDRAGDAPWIDWEIDGNKREVSMVAGVVCVGMGDAAASLIGRRYGRHKWVWVGGKSLEGSAAFAIAVTTGLLAGKAWQVLGGWNDSAASLASYLGRSGSQRCVMAWLATLLKAVFCACGASFMEAVLTGANDNVVVPVALWLFVKGTRL
ncbi:hypothetical protein M433DRAFT_144577 [Acidomyces richmondensis BFW]|nr:MAG: hypothetical protein FE78DRAFT_81133 [Acidomyces sp. 'richmondensis']KYG44777.1 hypothetical protein M433DRAFT_144577 [Acidomyces richmondensis BFW]